MRGPAEPTNGFDAEDSPITALPLHDEPDQSASKWPLGDWQEQVCSSRPRKSVLSALHLCISLILLCLREGPVQSRRGGGGLL